MPILIDQRPVNLQIQLLLSTQRALLDQVEPNLRSVQLDWDDSKEVIYLYFYFDKEVTSENRVSASCIAGEIAGDFSSSVEVLEKCTRIDFPNEIPSHKLFAFRRKEGLYRE
jgi:hypothetical protein